MDSNFTYPETRRDKNIIDDFHGTSVADPYRWLEGDSEENDIWIAAQNQLTADYISEISARTHIHRRLTALWNYPKYYAPSRYGETYFSFFNDGLKNQPCIV